MRSVKNIHALFIGLAALTAFSPCIAMQREDKGLESTGFRSIDKKRVTVLLMAAVASTLPEGAQAQHIKGSVYGASVTQELDISVCNGGKAVCTRYQNVYKNDDDTWELPHPSGFDSPDWHCRCKNPHKEEKASQLIELPQVQSYDNATCPVRQEFSRKGAIRNTRKADVVYKNATCPVSKREKFPLQKRNGQRGQQRGGKKGRR